MEKAILKTLIYADIFEFPLTIWEIHRWLISKKSELKQVDKTLKKLLEKGLVEKKGEYFFLNGRKKMVLERIKKQKVSEKYLKTAKLISWCLKIVPTIKLIGLSGSLALNNASLKDDIDLFLITSQKRIWLTRLMVLILLELMGKRRKREDEVAQASGKVCINLILEEGYLAQENKDIYIAHEVLQMMVLYQKMGVYQKFLSDNEWVFEYLPNWTTNRNQASRVKNLGEKQRLKKTNKLVDILEKLAKDFQMAHIGIPQGAERVTDHELYFHPEDNRSKILFLYKKGLKELI